MSTPSMFEDRITRNPGIFVGKPIIKGTRVPVDLIVDFFNNGASIEEIVDDYPDLTIDDVQAALQFARCLRDTPRVMASRIAP